MKTFMRRILPILVTSLLVMSLKPMGVRAQSPWFSIDPSSGPAGAGVTITGGGDFTPDQKGQVFWVDDGSFLGDAIIDGKGIPSGSFSIPGYAAPGSHDILLDTGIDKAYSSFTVIDTKPTDTPVPVPAPVIYNFYLVPQTIPAGDCSTLYWDVFDAQSVVVSGDFGSQSVDLSGSLKVCPPTTTTYTIRADGFKGAVPPSVSAGIILTVTTVVIDTPTFTPSRTPTKFPGYDNTPTFTSSRTPTKFPGYINTPTFTPSRTPTKFPGYINTPTFTPSITPSPTFLWEMSNNIAPMVPLFNNPTSPLGFFINRIPPGSPCGTPNIGPGARVISFDDVPSGRLTDRYGSVIFATDTAFVGSPSVRTHSGRNALTSYFSDLGSVNHPILMTFHYPASAVGMVVGREAPSAYASEGIVAVLTGYGATAGGTSGIVAQAEVELPGEPTNIDRCLVIRAPAGLFIQSANLEYLNSAGHSVADPRWMDDLTFVSSYDRIPDLPPVVTITQPVNGSTITTDMLNLQIDITEDVGLDRFNGLAVFVNGNTTPQYLTVVRDALNPVHYQATTSLLDGLQRFNTNTVRVVATDTAGQTGQASVSFTFRPASAVDIIIESIEVTQATQYMFEDWPPNNYMQLITNKPTLVRVYAHMLSGPVNLDNISGALCRGLTDASGCTNPIRPFAPISLHRVGSEATSALRTRLDLTLNFLVPMDWLRAGEALRMTAYINYNQENARECCYDNNFRQVGADVVAGQALNLIVVGLNVNGYTAEYNLRWNIASGINDVYPISRVNLYRFGSLGLGSINYADGGWSPTLNTLDNIRRAFGYSTPYLRWYGLVPRDALQPHSPGGMGRRPGYVSAGFSKSTSLLDSISVAAEEVAHNHGRMHASGTNGAQNPDPGYPRSDGTIDQVGVNVRTQALYLTTAGDYMSYNTPHGDRWTSTYTYEAMFQAVNSVAYNPFGGIHAARLVQQGILSSFLVGGGTISPEAVQFSGNFFLIPRTDPLWDESPAGPYTLELLDVNGNILFTRGFGVLENDDTEPSNTGDFQFVVPWVEGMTSAVIKFSGSEIGRRSASPNVPAVQVLAPLGGENWDLSGPQTISWFASDADGDSLTYQVQYSPDKGTSWFPLSAEIPDTSLVVDTANLPGGSSGIIRVLASDGFNTGMGFSENPFSVAAKPPEVFISNPQDDNQLSPGWPVILTAIGTDLEDGPLSQDVLRWSSDVDGDLGSGDYLIASTQNMTPGSHIITLTGTDSTGQSASFTTHINLVAPPSAAVAGPAESTSANPPTFLIILIALAGVVLIAGIVLVLVLLRRRK